ncbi:MAG TPA: hypothetical protein VEX18_13670 [Polyangiaceae bacterium]|nr:hypothetical protein [Polyangiaceae bacterium]
MQRRALLLCLGALGACGPRPRPAPPPAPAVRAASEFIPPDLDVVARLDWGRMKGALGSLALAALSLEVLARSGAGAPADELVLSSLLTADQVYLGYRPSPLFMPLDRVLSLQGRFEPITRPPAGFRAAVDLGGDLRHWDREPGAPLERGGVARIYALGDRLRVFVSEAELDAVERLLGGQGGERRLTPPEEGTLSLAARPWLLARLSGRGSLRDMLEQARTLYLVLELEADGAAVELQLTLANAERAQRLAAAGKEVLVRVAGRLAPDAVLRAEGERVLLSVKLSRSQLGPALACLRDASDPDCAW